MNEWALISFGVFAPWSCPPGWREQVLPECCWQTDDCVRCTNVPLSQEQASHPKHVFPQWGFYATSRVSQEHLHCCPFGLIIDLRISVSALLYAVRLQPAADGKMKKGRGKSPSPRGRNFHPKMSDGFFFLQERWMEGGKVGEWVFPTCQAHKPTELLLRP